MAREAETGRANPEARPGRGPKASLIGSVAILSLTSLVGVACGSSNKIASTSSNPEQVAIAPITGFGGYNWKGDVNSISARWQVPTIDPASHAGYAATWIGAQATVSDRAFVQLGIIEHQMGPVRSDHSRGNSEYEAFWSDSNRHYFPVELGAVLPGTIVNAAMTRTGSGWKLTLSDGARQLASGLNVHQATAVPYDQGEWIQEDPPPTNMATHDVPYPAMSTVTFQQLRINGGVPQLTFADAKALASNAGVDLVPTQISSDTFSLLPATGAAKQWLVDAVSIDDAGARLERELSHWSRDTETERAQAVAAYVSAITDNASILAEQTWPDSVRADMSQELQDLGRSIDFLKGWLTLVRANETSIPANPVGHEVTAEADRIREALGLPPV